MYQCLGKICIENAVQLDYKKVVLLGLPELLFSSDCFSFSLQLRRNFLEEGSEVALLLLKNVTQTQ